MEALQTNFARRLIVGQCADVRGCRGAWRSRTPCARNLSSQRRPESQDDRRRLARFRKRSGQAVRGSRVAWGPQIDFFCCFAQPLEGRRVPFLEFSNGSAAPCDASIFGTDSSPVSQDRLATPPADSATGSTEAWKSSMRLLYREGVEGSRRTCLGAMKRERATPRMRPKAKLCGEIRSNLQDRQNRIRQQVTQVRLCGLGW